MTRGPIDDYLDRLARELRQRGVEDTRIIDETREHLLDAVEAARRHGLSVDDAAREALERFGAPETVVAHVVPERDRAMNGFAAALDTVWRRKWWILAPTVVTAVLTSVMSPHFLPTRYRSESLIQVLRVSVDGLRPADIASSRARFREISQVVLSRTRLERIINEFKLYQVEQTREPLDDLVQQMRRDISIEWLASDRWEDADGGGFNVSFVSADPIVALKVTQRLTGGGRVAAGRCRELMSFPMKPSRRDIRRFSSRASKPGWRSTSCAARASSSGSSILHACLHGPSVPAAWP